MKPVKPEKNISQLLRTLGQPTRVQILLAIGEGEACVCHLESILKKRQAYISQHLMALREAKILTSRKEGRFVFYSLQDPRYLDLVQKAGDLAGVSKLAAGYESKTRALQGCVCPQCETLASPVAT